MTDISNVPDEYKDKDVRTLREWLKVPTYAKQRDVIALACTAQDLEPSMALSMNADQTVVDKLAADGAALYEQVMEANKVTKDRRHWAPIMPAKGLLCAIIAQKPSVTLYDEFMALSMNGEGYGKEKLAALSQSIAECALYPDPGKRHKMLVEYPQLKVEFGSMIMGLAGFSAEEITGKL